MTVSEAIRLTDELFPNSLDRQHKLRWLSQADGLIRALTVDVRPGGPDTPFEPYSDAQPDRELVMPRPYCEAYLYWLAAKMDLVNGETALYNNRIAQFSALLDEFTAFVSRSACPAPVAVRLP